MERRDFLKKACITCAGIGLGAALIEACATPSMAVLRTSPANGMVAIPLDTFATSNFKMVRVSNYNYDIAVMKQPSGDYLALLLMCTHAGQALTKTGSGYLCPLHGSRFSETGAVLKSPATDPLEHLQTSTDNQHLYVKLDANYYSK
jgi:cytochrome b6-f complex iron-sulfur subunit